MDKLGVIIDARPLRIHLGNHSVESLIEFSKSLMNTLQNTPADEPKKEIKAEPKISWMGIDFIDIGAMSIHVYSKSDTHLSLVNFLPDIELEFTVDPFHNRRSTSKRCC